MRQCNHRQNTAAFKSVLRLVSAEDVPHRLRERRGGTIAGAKLLKPVQRLGGEALATPMRPLMLTPAGPVLPARAAQMRTTAPRTFVSVLDTKDTVIVRTASAIWVVAFVVFWVWWFRPEHQTGWTGLVINSLLLFHFSYLPVYFLVMVNRLRRINPELAIPKIRTAFLVTKAPSEPWCIARRTLEAMLAQRFPYTFDVWLCDESPDDEVRAWCTAHGVRVSCREGRAEYHRTEWPRRARCKEGNVAFFYDRWGYKNYDVVVQLDCDHIPSPTYLGEMVRPFSDPAIGYVAAPSVNDSNAATSWSARGRLHFEAIFHGPIQLGHSDRLAPSCIGSHYAVRTQALQDIGGIGPELAEDFSTSFLLTSAGWRSAFADSAEAHGEGPITFTAMVTQEFQWARSLMMLALDTVPLHLRRLPWPLRARFLFALSYYPVLSLAMIGGLALPVIAAIDGTPWVNVHYGQFLMHWLSMDLCLLGLVLFLRSRGLLRPAGAPLISWEGCIYAFVRWPFIMWGVIAAVMQKVRPTQIMFRVTPKSARGLEPIAIRVVAPYCTISAGLASAALIGQATTDAIGYVFLCLLTASCYAVVAVAVPLLHAAEAARHGGVGLWVAIREACWDVVILAAAASVLTTAAILGFPAYVAAWS